MNVQISVQNLSYSAVTDRNLYIGLYIAFVTAVSVTLPRITARFSLGKRKFLTQLGRSKDVNDFSLLW